MPSPRAPRAVLLRAACVAALASSALACKAPDRGAGVFVEYPEHIGRDLVTIHHGTFSDVRPNIRIRTEGLGAGELLVANLEYPTSGKANREIDPLLDGHAAFITDYLSRHPEAGVTMVGFSQGGCVELDVVTRIARAAPELLERASLVLIAPARAVETGASTAVAKRMIARCEAAELELDTMATAAPEGTIARMLRERTFLTWSCNDPIVGHDSFTVLSQHLPPEHVLYRERLRHVPWASKVHRTRCPAAPYGDRIELATGVARAVAEGREPREALAAYVEFGFSCE